MDYLISSHSTSDIVMTPYHPKQKAFTERRQFKLGSLTSGTLRLKRMTSESSLDEYAQLAKEEEEVSVDPTVTGIRNQVLRLILNLCIEHGDVLVEELHQRLKLDLVLALIHHPSLECRVLLLQIIDLYLHTQSTGTMTKLSRMNGFGLLGNQLRLHRVSAQMFDMLFSMSMGKPINVVPHKKVPKSKELDQQKTLQTNFVGVIIAIVDNCRADDLVLWHSVIDKLLQLMKTKSTVMELMLEEGMTDNITDLLVGIQGRVVTESGPSTPVRESASSPYLSEKFRPLKNFLSRTPDRRRSQDLVMQREASLSNTTPLPDNPATPEKVETAPEEDTATVEGKLTGAEDAEAEVEEYADDQESGDAMQIPKPSPGSSPPMSPLTRRNTDVDEEDLTRASRTEINENGEFENHASGLVIDEETSLKMEKDIISLLKEIAVYGCKTKGFGVVDDILISLSRLEGRGLSRFHVQGLQRSIFKEALDFFYIRLSSEAASSSDSMITSFVNLCMMAIDHIIWSEPASPSTQNTEAKDLEFRFIQFVFTALRGIFMQSSQEDGNSAVVDFLPFFAAQVAVQAQMARLILHLISARQPLNHREFVLQKLSENLKFLADFGADPAFNSKLVHSLTEFLFHKESPSYKAATSVSDFLLSRQKTLYREVFLEPKSYEVLLTQSNMSQVQFTQVILKEVSTSEEKNTVGENRWRTDRHKAKGQRDAQLRKYRRHLRADCHQLSATVMNLQHQCRKPFYQRISQLLEQEKVVENGWKDVIARVTHERAVWHQDYGENGVWQVNNTEGPYRVRSRLERVTSDFFYIVPTKPGTERELTEEEREDQAVAQLPFLFAEDAATDQKTGPKDNLSADEKVIQVAKCIRITPFSKRDGELIIRSQNLCFVDAQVYEKEEEQKARVYEKKNALKTNENWKETIEYYLQWPLATIKEIHKRRNLLKNNALEIFLTNGKTYLLAFMSVADRDSVYSKVISLSLPNWVNYEDEVSGSLLRKSINEKWSAGLISNFDYLMHLNTMAGRTLNDLTQYPVFPFILADYTSEELDLENPATFRDLTKPMGAQDAKRLQKFIERYDNLVDMKEPPYHYGSHYSTMGTVLYFLVRLEPFTQFFLQFQGGRFDIPDRSFHSVANTWTLASSYSTTDVKELIPEFFYLPEGLLNINNYDMGTMQSGAAVDNVILPPWAKNNPRLFIQKHREALESQFVSENLHHWIDLIFGSKQQGEEALKALNVFHPLTYEGAIDVDAIEDELEQAAAIQQINSYGQTPTRLFTKKHAARKHPEQTPLSSLVKSPGITLAPLWRKELPEPISSLEFHAPSQILHALPVNRVLLKPDCARFISYDYWDQTLRVGSVDTGKQIHAMETFQDDNVICCAVSSDGNVVATGGTASVVKVWEVSKKLELRLKAVLDGHLDRVTAICICREFSLIVSGGGSLDRTCILWDLNTLAYVQSLETQPGPLVAIVVSTNTVCP